MAYQKKGVQDKTYIADYKSDLASIPSVSMGSTCWVIETAEKFDLLLGDNLQGRKDYIANFGHLYIDMTDVS